MQPGLRLRHIIFHGPNRKPAGLEFGPGLNILYGASESGKSFVVEAIDFMLGGKLPLRDIPERVGYDRILLGIETLDGEQQFTLLRSVEGGAFQAFKGLHLVPPGPEFEKQELGEIHNERNTNNLSMFLLKMCGLDGRRLRKNKYGETNSLSFRNLARLAIVDETEIIAKLSPLSDGNPSADTSNFATFKLLLTGIDDSALVPVKPDAAEEQSRDAQLELLDQLIEEYKERLSELTKDPGDLEDQLRRLEETLSQHAKVLATSETEYRDLAIQRRKIRQKVEEGRDRRAEIESLLERFSLLDDHYESDLARLHGIEEGGTLFQVLGQASCPLCGAEATHHRKDSDCDGNVEAVVSAARSEIAKIELLRVELNETVGSLEREATGFNKRVPKLENDLSRLSRGIEELIAPKLTQLRSAYAGLADKRGEVREALAILKSIKDAESRRIRIENSSPEQKESTIAEGDLQSTVADAFAVEVESLLKAWHFPEAERVFFDPKRRDIVIAGKPRTARGKGLRAITHAAFNIALLQFCKTNATPHPSFVVLDTPLRAYREPEGKEDDLRGTDLNIRFYDFLAGLPNDRQVVVVENSDPPDSIAARPQVTMFSGNPHSGRCGFFPLMQPPELR